MSRCSWCNTDPVIAAAQYSGPHATWCPHCSKGYGPNSAEIEAQMERAQEIFRRLRLLDDNEGQRLLARALAAVAIEMREVCVRLAAEHDWVLPVAAIRALAPTSPPR